MARNLRAAAVLLLLAVVATGPVWADDSTPPSNSGGGSSSGGSSSGSSGDSGPVLPDENKWLARQTVPSADGCWTIYEGGIIKQHQAQ